ncbi:MAG: (2Fe-2S)-binding protein [Fimbriimonas sp.]
MSESVQVRIDGESRAVPAGTSVAVAVGHTRRSVTGESRAAFCGMGICFECRLTIDGTAHARSCLVLVREGMEIRTDG